MLECGGGKGRCGSEEKCWVTCWSVGKVGEMWGCGKVCRGVGEVVESVLGCGGGRGDVGVWGSLGRGARKCVGVWGK